MRKVLIKLPCKHIYEKVDWKEQLDEYTNTRYSLRKYKCSKCGKEIWLDGRYTQYIR